MAFLQKSQSLVGNIFKQCLQVRPMVAHSSKYQPVWVRSLNSAVMNFPSAPEASLLAVRGGKTCSHVYVHNKSVHSKSEGDIQFIEFLSSEIISEDNESRELPTMTGFQVETKGPRVKFIKSINGETITVEFDVNNSVGNNEDEPEDDLDESEAQDPLLPEMTSTPDFDITIAKEGYPSRLGFKCQLIDPVLNKDIPKDEVDNFEIVEVAMIDGTEWDDNTHYVNAELLDANMYDMLMLMLEERGINHTTFCQQLVDYSTAYEHSAYVKLLKSMRKFVQK